MNIKKIIISVILSVTFVFSDAVVALANNNGIMGTQNLYLNEVISDNAVVYKGDIIKTQIYLENLPADLRGCDIAIYFDPTVISLVSFADDATFGDGTETSVQGEALKNQVDLTNLGRERKSKYGVRVKADIYNAFNRSWVTVGNEIYPVVDNANGIVKIANYTETRGVTITDKTLMLELNFKAIGAGNSNIRFSTDDNDCLFSFNGS